ncbi:hypothetical protein PMIN04_013234 [Paraphaeosphaeria minitans]
MCSWTLGGNMASATNPPETTRWGRLSTDSPCKRIECLSMHAPHLIADFGSLVLPRPFQRFNPCRQGREIAFVACVSMLRPLGKPMALVLYGCPVLLSADIMPSCGARIRACKMNVASQLRIRPSTEIFLAIVAPAYRERASLQTFDAGPDSRHGNTCRSQHQNTLLAEEYDMGKQE